MHSSSKFRNDLRIGSIAELQVIDFYRGCGLKTTPVDASSDERSYWDLISEVPAQWMLPKNKLTTEVKFDVKAQTTGNLAIEVGNSTKNMESGIKITRALLWAHVLSDSIYLCRTKDLITFVDYVPPRREFKNAGDGNAHIKVYNSNVILSAIFHRVDNLSKVEAIAKVKKLCHAK